VCGVSHSGHVRSGLDFDVLRRWLARTGHQVTLVRNVTDIDDKILGRAAAAGRPWWEWAATHERAFRHAYDVLGCLPPSVEPRATGHITEMVELMARLVGSGHAYASDGNVYFAVTGYPDYGALSGQRPDEVEQGETAATGKRDPRDFTLWKAAKPGEPSWPTPWGRGRPGWHLECSAMATRYLGPEFDIHGGGLDLVFPHHENERAQSQAAGDGFARYWLHNAWVTTGGEKMSKSLGNTLAIPAVLTRVRPVELRYYLIGPHYRSAIEYSEGALTEAAAAFRRVESFVHRVGERCGPPELGRVLCADFVAAMDDDLGPPPPIFQIGRRDRLPRGVARWLIAIAIGLVLYTAADIAKGIYADLLWFESLGYASVYTTEILTRLWLFFAGAAIFLVLIAVNLALARRLAPQGYEESFIAELEPATLRRIVTIGLVVASLFLAVIFGSAAAGE